MHSEDSANHSPELALSFVIMQWQKAIEITQTLGNVIVEVLLHNCGADGIANTL